jgi:Flp pilus assembly protein TadG
MCGSLKCWMQNLSRAPPALIHCLDMTLLGVGRKGSRRARGEGGQALVEIALVMPFLLLLVTAIIQFGIMLSDYSTLVNAAREGARTLALGATLSDPCDAAVNQAVSSVDGAFTLTGASGYITPSFPTSGQATAGEDYCGTPTGCTYQYETSCNTNGAEVPGDQAEVTIVYPYTLKVFGMGLFSVNLTTSSTNAIE